MIRTFLIGSMVLALSGATAAQTKPAAPQPSPAAPVPTRPVIVRTSTSQTAAWVGDRITYTIELQCAPGVDILTDDLVPDRMKLDGLEVVDTATERDASAADRVVHRMRYTLVTYSVDAPALTIAPLAVRYSVRQPGQRAEDALPAGEVTVPELTLAVRSTLPVSGAVADVRDARPVQPLPRRIQYAKTTGIILLAFSAAPVALWIAGIVQRARLARPQRKRRPSARERREALDVLRALDVVSDADRREAYARLDAWIREQVHVNSGVAGALTPAEISARMPATKTHTGDESLERLLIECERAKYSPDLPPSDRWHAAVDEAAEWAQSARR